MLPCDLVRKTLFLKISASEMDNLALPDNLKYTNIDILYGNNNSPMMPLIVQSI